MRSYFLEVIRHFIFLVVFIYLKLNVFNFYEIKVCRFHFKDFVIFTENSEKRDS